MTFKEVLAQVIDWLQQDKRLSYRALKRQFALDDDYLDDLRAELIEVRRVAVEEDGRVLVWTGDTAPASAPPSVPTVPPARVPFTYTPSYLAEKILTSRSALEGERKQVTVLFADLKGSTELIADLDPEAAQQLLDPALQRMMDAVHRYEGTVNQVLGDGIMALFGAPIAHEDHAVRACYAALAMQAAMRRYAEEVRRPQSLEMQIRVGLNSGEVVVRTIGNDLHMDYSAVGQTTHLAARMEQMAQPGSTLITADTLQLAAGYVQVKPLGPVPIRGFSAPLEVYEVVGAGPARTHLQAVGLRELTQFVGRAAELHQLCQALERAGAGHGQVMAVLGEPGVGKTRLFYECLSSFQPRGWLLLESSAVSYGTATPYLPVIELLKVYFQLGSHEAGRQSREQVASKLRTLDPALLPTLPAFLTLFDVPVEDPSWQALEPPQRRQRLLEAVKGLLLRESQVQPLLLVVENLHWIDAETQALLDSLVESLPTARLLLLVNYRPEYQHSWGSKTYYTQLRLDPLPPERAEELLQALLGDDPHLEPLKQLLIEQTEGNPFFLEESVRTLVETGVLVGEPGAYRVVQALPAIQVPATVQAVLAARIDRLPPEEKQLLQAAAVIGRDVPFALLEAIAEAPEEVLHVGFTRLRAAELLYETRLFPDLEYTFKHALTHEVAYGSLLQERRRALHARIVEALERLYPARLAEHVERLAHHALRGEVWDKALAYCRQAGTKAAERSAHREAVACLEQALVALRYLPENRATREQAIDLRTELRNSLHPLGAFARSLDYLREAETIAEALGDHRRLGRVSVHMTDYYRVMGDLDRALESGQRALGLATTLGDHTVQVAANFRLGQVYHTLGEYRQAMHFFKSNVEALKGERLRERFGLASLPSVSSRSVLAESMAEVGAFADGIAQGEEGVRMAEATEHPFSLVMAYAGLGFAYLRQGDMHLAIAVLERGLSVCQVWHIPLLFPGVASALGYAYALCERLADAVPLLEQAVEQATVMTRTVDHALRLAHLSEAYLLAGRMDDALQLARRALELAQQHKERGHETYALRLLGEVAARHDPPDVTPAEASYRQALALAEELGMRPLQAHCHRGVGTLYATTGQAEQAHAELSTAIKMYQAMGMTFWLPQTEAALVQVEGR